ncbi:MAG: hypothetical protein AAB250_04935, partial [Bdellovibrionota bacterium]
FALTWIEFWDWSFFSGMTLQWRHWWIGDCSVDLADWPILPWIGIIWMPYAIGAWDRLTSPAKESSRLGAWRKWEWALWPVLLIASIPQLGVFYEITLGPMFACFSFRQAPFVFWSNFVFVVFLLRVSLLESVQTKLERFAVARAIGRLRLNQSFGISYLIHYTLIEAIVYFWRPVLAASPDLALVAMLSILPVTEISVRGIEALFSRLRRSSSSRAA